MNFLMLFLALTALCLTSGLATQIKSDRILGQEAYSSLSNIVRTGGHLGLQECQKQFKNEIWNCSFDFKHAHKTLPIFVKKILPYATRETAFVHAVSSAAITHEITVKCSQGVIPECGCMTIKKELKPADDWKWGGCSDNIRFGEKVTRRFIDELENGRDARTAVNKHNNEVGRKVVRSNAKKECKCHGVTGSCSFKTCWRELGPFGEVGARLKQMYQDAARVSFVNKKLHLQEGTKRQSRSTSNKERKLVYLVSSPNYCMRNHTIGSPGVLGRTCRGDEASTSQCRSLCETCGLRHQTVEKYKQIKCRCKFVWCCSVRCDKCTTKYSVTTCTRP